MSKIGTKQYLVLKIRKWHRKFQRLVLRMAGLENLTQEIVKAKVTDGNNV